MYAKCNEIPKLLAGLEPSLVDYENTFERKGYRIGITILMMIYQTKILYLGIKMIRCIKEGRKGKERVNGKGRVNRKVYKGKGGTRGGDLKRKL